MICTRTIKTPTKKLQTEWMRMRIKINSIKFRYRTVNRAVCVSCLRVNQSLKREFPLCIRFAWRRELLCSDLVSCFAFIIIIDRRPDSALLFILREACIRSRWIEITIKHSTIEAAGLRHTHMSTYVKRVGHNGDSFRAFHFHPLTFWLGYGGSVFCLYLPSRFRHDHDAGENLIISHIKDSLLSSTHQQPNCTLKSHHWPPQSFRYGSLSSSAKENVERDLVDQCSQFALNENEWNWLNSFTQKSSGHFSWARATSSTCICDNALMNIDLSLFVPQFWYWFSRRVLAIPFYNYPRGKWRLEISDLAVIATKMLKDIEQINGFSRISLFI